MEDLNICIIKDFIFKFINEHVNSMCNYSWQTLIYSTVKQNNARSQHKQAYFEISSL